ncbi:MAG: glycosyltransferase 87 family protein [Mycobacteriales bacterium]
MNPRPDHPVPTGSGAVPGADGDDEAGHALTAAGPGVPAGLVVTAGQPDRSGGGAARVWAAVGGLLTLAGLLAAAFAAGRPNDARWLLLGLVAAAWLVFPVAVWLVLRTPPRRAVPIVLAGAALLQLATVAVPPRSTDDLFRYAWDGRVQAAGTDPYRHLPVDPALAPLRDDWLFPPECRDRVPVCTIMNHPGSPTIYPPVAEAYFLAVHLLSPPGSRWKPWQLAAALLALLTTLALIGGLRRAGRDPRWAVLWAWCPLVVIEAGNSAHVDVLAALLAVVGLRLVAARRPVAAGGLLGAAVAVKLYPALLLPAVLRRRGAPIVAAAALTFAVSYVPHVLAVGTKVLGYLPGYLKEEGYDGSGRFPVLRLLLPGMPPPVTLLLAALLLAAVAGWAAWRADPDRPWDGAVVLTGVAVLLAGPNYPWYALLLVALIALSGRWEWMPAAAAAYLPYFVGALDLEMEPTKKLAYGTATALVLLLLAARGRPSGPAFSIGWPLGRRAAEPLSDEAVDLPCRTGAPSTTARSRPGRRRPPGS